MYLMNNLKKTIFRTFHVVTINYPLEPSFTSIFTEYIVCILEQFSYLVGRLLSSFRKNPLWAYVFLMGRSWDLHGWGNIENSDDDIYPEWILFSSITFFKFPLTSVKLVIDLQRCEYGLELKKTDFLFVLI